MEGVTGQDNHYRLRTLELVVLSAVTMGYSHYLSYEVNGVVIQIHPR